MGEFNTRQVRILVQARGHLLGAGWEIDDPLVAGLTEIRDIYIQRVGLATYVSQMLGEFATREMWECRLEWAKKKERDVAAEVNERVQDYVKRCWGNDLPYLVEVMGEEETYRRFL